MYEINIYRSWEILPDMDNVLVTFHCVRYVVNIWTAAAIPGIQCIPNVIAP